MNTYSSLLIFNLDSLKAKRLDIASNPIGAAILAESFINILTITIKVIKLYIL